MKIVQTFKVERILFKQGGLQVEDGKVNDSVWPSKGSLEARPLATVADDSCSLLYLTSPQDV